MKKAAHLIWFMMFFICARAQEKIHSVNAILNDQSYIDLFGVSPTNNTNEQLRIQTHLLYVEGLLRSTDVSSLNNEQLAKRTVVLHLLHEYILAGVFPKNKMYPGERRPCFIDDDGNICAVGFLVEKTAGREVAEHINIEHQYDFLLDMNDPIINNWAYENGLSLIECAMIQPTYSYYAPLQVNADIKSGYGIASGILGGSNIAMLLSNLSPQFRNKKYISYVSIATGTSQLVMGLMNIRKSTINYGINAPDVTTYYKAQNNLSYANIAVGTASIVTGAFNLILRKHIKNFDNTISIYSFPDNNSIALGMHFTKRL
ncbi:MAG: hypothetical protein IT249_03935 [Chitinophagaceae bacterium]|nr:hypothetical protein [Chitinophagaceae bacterium]